MFNLWKDRSSIPAVYPITVVNPFNGVTQDLPSDYPNLKGSVSGPPGTLQFVYSTVVYDPSLTLVVYPETIDGQWNIVLWDREAMKAIAKLKVLGEFQHTPLWSPDGQQFAIAAIDQIGKQPGQWTEDWFSVSRQGQIQQLTHFGNHFDLLQIGAGNWSPNGQLLAFWLTAKPSACEGQVLAILEIETQQTTDYCVLGSVAQDAPPPVWSLDSQYIAVQNRFGANASRVILVDVAQSWAAQICENVQPAGWLATP